MLRVEDVVTGYGEIEVLHGISLTIAAGEAVALLGLNGAGKSTLLSVIAGHQRSWRGSVRVDGCDVTRASAHSHLRRDMAVVPESRELFPGLSVEENLRAAMIASKTRRSLVAERIEAVTALFPVLREKRKQPAGLLSGGQQQMLAIARALTTEPKLLLLDEPSLGLAPVLVSEIYGQLAQMRSSGISMLIVEQHVHEAVAICDRLCVLELGRITREGSTDEIRSDPEFAQTYLGQ